MSSSVVFHRLTLSSFINLFRSRSTSSRSTVVSHRQSCLLSLSSVRCARGEGHTIRSLYYGVQHLAARTPDPPPRIEERCLVCRRHFCGSDSSAVSRQLRLVLWCLIVVSHLIVVIPWAWYRCTLDAEVRGSQG